MPNYAEGESPFTQTIWLHADGNTYDTNSNQNGIGYGGIDYDPGVQGKAFHLDGVDDEVRITREYPKYSDGSAYSFWFKRDIGGPIVDRNLLAFRAKGGSGWGLVSKSTGAIEFKLDSIERTKKPIFTSDILDNGWHFVTLSVNDTLQQITVQIDSGTEVIRNYRGQIPSASSGYTTVGASAFGASWFDGRIDELRIIDLATWNSRTGLHQKFFVEPMPDIGNIQLTGGNFVNAMSVPENAPPGTLLGQVQLVTDGGRFFLADDSGGAFQIDSTGSIYVNQGSNLDHEAHPERSITVGAKGSNSRIGYKTFPIHVLDVNESIQDIVISSSRINAWAPASATVARARAVDPDVGEVFEYALYSESNNSTNLTVGAFSIDPLTGIVSKTTTQPLTSLNSAFTVQATDRAGHRFRKSGQIEFDDSLPSVWPEGNAKQFWISSEVVQEGESAHLKLRRAKATNNLTVTYSTEDRTAIGVGQTTVGGDYLNKQGTIVFTVGEYEKEIEVVTLYDYQNEDLETLLVRATTPEFGTVTSAISINNAKLPTLFINGQDIQLSDPRIVVAEGSTAVVEISESTIVHGPVAYGARASFEYSTRNWGADENDYEIKQGIVTATSSERTKFSVLIPTTKDLLKEHDESFLLRIKTPWNTSEEIPITISDGTNDIPKARFSRAQEFANETEQDSEPTPVLTIYIPEGGLGQLGIQLESPFDVPITVSYQSISGSATSADYQPVQSSLTFLPGELWKPITIQTRSDYYNETDEVFFMSLSTPWHQVSESIVWIRDEKLPELQVSDVSVLGGNMAAFTVSLSSAIQSAAIASYSIRSGVYRENVSRSDQYGIVTFQPGETQKTVLVSTATWIPPENNATPTLPKISDFFLDVSVPWARDIGRALVTYPEGYPLSGLGLVDANDMSVIYDLAELYGGTPTSGYFPNYFAASLSNRAYESASVVQSPTHGRVEVYADGAFKYRPFEGFTGLDSFGFMLSNGTSSDTARVNIQVVNNSHSDLDRFMLSGGGQNEILPTVSSNDVVVGLKGITFGDIAPTNRFTIKLPTTSDYVDQVCRPMNDSYYYFGDSNSSYSGKYFANYDSESPSYLYVYCDRHRMFDSLSDDYDSSQIRDRLDLTVFPSGRVQLNAPFTYGTSPLLSIPYEAKLLNGFENSIASNKLHSEVQVQFATFAAPPLARSDQFGGVSTPVYANTTRNMVGNVFENDSEIVRDNAGVVRDLAGRAIYATSASDWESRRLLQIVSIPAGFPKHGRSVQGGYYSIQPDGDVLYTPPVGFVGVDYMTYAIKADDGEMGIVSDSFVANVNAGDAFIGGRIAVLVDSIPVSHSDTKSSDVQPYSIWTHTPSGVDTYSGTDQGIYVWNDHNQASIDLEIDGLSLLGNDVGGAGPLEAFVFYAKGNPNNLTYEKGMIGPVVAHGVKGLEFKVPVGYVGDLTLYYHLREDDSELLTGSSVSLSIHGSRYVLPNLGPTFISAPIQIGFPSEPYRYQALAVDPEGQAITYALTSNEPGLSIVSNTGLVRWDIPEGKRGETFVSILATDQSAKTATQEYWIRVAAANQPPIFTTNPLVIAEVGTQYSYAFAAKDPDGDQLHFVLRAPLEWEIVDNGNGTGTLTHSFQNADSLGPIMVYLDAADIHGAMATQAFEVRVIDRENHAPIFTSTPKIRFELAGRDLAPLGDVKVVQPAAQANRQRLWFNLAKGEKVNATVQFSVLAAPPKVDVMLLLDDTESFEGPNSLLSSRFLEIANRLKANYPNTDFGFGVSRFEDFKTPYSQDTLESRPFILNQPILDQSYPRFQEVMESALQRANQGHGGLTSEESLVEALYQLASGIGFDGTTNGTTLDDGSAGSLQSQIGGMSDDDVPRSQFGVNSKNNFVVDTASKLGYRVVKISDQPLLPLNQTVIGNLDNSLKATIYRVNAKKGDVFSLLVSDWQAVDAQSDIHLYLPNGQRLQPKSTVGGTRQFAIPETGQYALVIDREPSNSPRSNIPPTEVEYNEAKEVGADFPFRFTATLTAGNAISLNAAIPIELNEIISVGPLALGVPQEFSFELESTKLLLLKSIQGGGNWTLQSETGNPLRWGHTNGLQVLHATQFKTSGNLAGSVEDNSQPGQGGLPAGRYRLSVSLDQASDVPIQFQIIDSQLNSLTLKLGEDVQGRMDVDHQTAFIRFVGKTGQEVTFESVDSPSPFAAGSLITPAGSEIAFRGRAYPLFQKSDPIRLPLDGEYLIMVSASSFSGPIVPFTFKLRSKIEKELVRPQFDVSTARWNTIENLSVTDLQSQRIHVGVVAGDQVYFDGLNANARVRVDYFDANGTNLFSLKNSELNRMLPVATYSSDQYFILEPIDLIASVPRNRVGGGGFRVGALPIVITATDNGSVYRVDLGQDGCAVLDVHGVGTTVVDIRNMVGESFQEIASSGCIVHVAKYDAVHGHPHVPNSHAASVQDAVSALVDIGALVVGIGTGPNKILGNPRTPGSLLSELARLTGALNSSGQSVINGTVAPNDPLYVQLDQADPEKLKATILEAIDATLSYTGFDVDVLIRDNSGVSKIASPDRFSIHTDESKTVALEWIGDGGSHEFYLEFLRHGTNIILGRLPIGINYSYSYDADAIDPDGDAIAYSIVGDSHGATIDSVTGVVYWLPEAAGKYTFTVRADDGRGGLTTQQWEVDADPLNASNHAPIVNPIANQNAFAGRPFELQVIAADPDSDVLSFGLIAGTATDSIPQGMTIQERTGLIQWTPTIYQLGCPWNVIVAVNDGRGGVTQRSFQIIATAEQGLQNHRPVITSTPDSVAVVGQRYSYEIIASDADGDPIQTKLTTGPTGMTLNAATRTLVWIPSANDVGQKNVNIQVSDGQGGTTYQSFSLNVVAPNQPPEFIDVEPLVIEVSQEWNFLPDVIDHNGDVIVFSKVSGPSELTVSINGLVTWTPTALGSFRFAMQADDRRGGKTIQSFSIDVLSNVSAPPVIVSSPRGPAIIGDVWKYEILATDLDNDPLQYQLIDPPTGMKIGTSTNGKPEVQWIPASLSGNYPVQIWVTDDTQAKHGASQKFTLPVTQRNQLPVIRSIPFDAMVGVTWSYAFNAIDPDGDSLSYELLVQQPGMTIDSKGVLRWTPTLVDQVRFGSTRMTDPVVKIRVTDGHGGEAIEQVFTKVNPSINDGEHPFVANNSTGPIYLNDVWTHQLVGIDPDGNSGKIIFNYVNLRKNGAPVSDGGAIQVSSTGLISVNATAIANLSLDDPSYEIVVKLTDDEGSVREYKMQARFRTKNDWPTFTNAPTGELLAGQAWSFVSTAQDPDGHPITFSKSADSVGTVTYSGTVAFVPPSSASSNAYPLVLNVSDGSLSIDGVPIHRQQANMLIATEHPAGYPRITSHPPVAAVLNDAPGYRYQVTSLDSRLTYRLPTGPQGMAIDTNGLVTWKPTSFGNFPVVIEAINASLQTTVQRFSVSAIKPYRLNEPPEIVSTPVGPAARDADYSYLVKATDANGDVLEYSLLEHPEWMSIHSTTGRISGIPTSAGQFPVTVRVREVKAIDNDEFEDLQRFVLTVLQNAPPRIISSPPLNPAFTIGSGAFSYTVIATDPNTEDLSGLRYSLVNPILGATISQTSGVITYSTTDISQRGKHAMTVRVSDSSGATDEQSFTLQTLGPTNAAPVFTSSPRTTLPTGVVYALELKATDMDGDDVSYELVDPLPGMRLENGNVFVWTPPKSLITSSTVPRVAIRFRAKSARDFLTTDQPSLITITKFVENTPPSISSVPRKAAIVGFEYDYLPNASDSDNDVLYWKLEKGPSTIRVDASTGRMTWIPSIAELGPQDIVLSTSDGYGGIAKQSYSIEVRGLNTPPIIQSSPSPYARLGQVYSYSMMASDLDEDTLVYSIAGDAVLAMAQGWSINASTGQLTLRPVFPHGSHQFVTVAVRDGRGGEVEQQINVTVYDALVNKPPVFANTLPDLWIIGGCTQFRMNVDDSAPGSTAVLFRLVQSPVGMSIDELTGVISWRPTESQIGLHLVTIRVDDGEFYSVQSKPIRVRTNASPILEYIDDVSFTGGLDWSTKARATDADQDILAFSLAMQSGLQLPSGLAIDSKTGTIHWKSNTVPTTTAYALRVTAMDGLGGEDSSLFTVTLTRDAIPPTVQFLSDPGVLEATRDARILVTAQDEVSLQSGSLSVKLIGYSPDNANWTARNQPIALDDHGRATINSALLAVPGQASQIGYYQFEVTAKDTSNNIGYAGTNRVVILQVALDATPPDVSIQSPTYNQSILEPIDILATIDDSHDELSEYWVTIHPNEKPNQAIEVKRVVSHRETKNGVIATVDTTLLDNGQWILNVYAKDTQGNVAKKSVSIQLEGNYKPGVLSLAFTDLDLATPDVPIKVQRSYSSSRSNKVLDFGHGWALDFGIPKVEIAYAENASPGSGGYPVLLDGTRVIVTLSDGTREGFTFQPYPEHPNLLGINISWLPYFAPDKGNTSFLEVEKTPMLRVANGESSWEYVSFAAAESFHPASRAFGGFWKLYQQTGTQFYIDARVANTAWIEDRNGNRTTITPDGIEHWSGRRIAIARDKANENRITSVRDAMNQSINYRYDAIGNLIAITDRLDQTTNLTYHAADANVAGKEFLLKSIIDAAGREQLIATYSNERRLASLKDVENWTTAYGYDIRNREQSIDFGSNGTANDFKILLDRRGNPVKSIDAGGSQTIRSFDQQGNLLEQRQVIGDVDGNIGVKDDLVTRYNYNEFRQPEFVTDTRGGATRNIYDATLHQVTSVVSAAGLSTIFDYDRKGNLLKTTNPSGEKTLLYYLSRGQLDTVKNKDELTLLDNNYDKYGNLSETKDVHGHISEFEYDGNGRQTVRISHEKDANGGPMEIRDERVYDAADRVTSTRLVYRTKNSAGEWVAVEQWSNSTIYDPATGLIQSQIDPHGLRTEFFYDRRGNPIQVRREVATRVAVPNGTFTSQRVWTSQWTVYDEQGRMFLTTDTISENPALPATSPPLGANKNLYNAAGRIVGTQRLKNVVVRVVDTAGNAPTADFSNYNRLRSAILSNGSVVSSTETIYDLSGRAVRTRDANGLWSETYYGFAGEVVQTRSQTLDGQGKIIWMISRSAVDELGRSIVNADTFIEGSVAALNGTTGTRTFYDELGRSFKVERRSGIKLSLLDRYGAAVLDPSKAEGPYSIKIDNQGVDGSGNINLISRSLSYYDSQGRVTKSVTGIGPGHAGVETRYEFDALGRTVRQIGAPVSTMESPEPLRMVTETDYDDKGRAFRSWNNIRGRDQGGEVLIDRRYAQSSTHVFDHLGRAYKSIAADGTFTLMEFDLWGNIASETDAGGNTKRNDYDASGRIIAVTLPAVADPLDSDHDGITILDAPRFEYAYNWAGKQTVVQDSLGRRTTFSFDEFGRQVSRTLPAGDVETFTYNDIGQQVTHTSFEGIVTELVYDNGTTNLMATDPRYKVGSGRLLEQRFYSNAAAFAAGPSNASQKLQVTYDSFGRKSVTVRSANVAGIFTTTRTEQWFYDSDGRLIQQATPEGTINYAYGLVTGQKTRMWTTKATGFAAANLADAIEDTRYSYNELGWLVGVLVVEKNDTLLTTSQQEKTNFRHDLQGRQLRIDLPDGVIQSTEVNEVGAITRMRQYGADATAYDLGDNPKRTEFVYTYDASGLRTRLIEKFWMNADQSATTPDTAQQTIYDWAYDADKRLVSETIGSFDNAVDRTESFTLDLFGNRLKRIVNLVATPNLVDEVFTYHYDGNDRILDELLDNGNNGSVDKTTTYTWSGTQQASKNTATGTTPVSSQSFAYNLQGRLASVITMPRTGTKTQVDYEYDTSNIRINVTEYSDSNNNSTIEPGERTRATEYFIDHANHTGYAQTIVETAKNAAGQRMKRIAYTFGTDEITQTAYAPSPTGEGWGEGSSLTFGHDAHGSVRVLFDAAGAIAQAYTYVAYGELIAIHNAMAQAIGTVGTTGLESQALTSILYSGESFDSRIGQQYLRARWYQPTIGRFNRLDPFAGSNSNPYSFNKYGYTSGDPILRSDPTGEYEGLSGLLVSFAIGGGVTGGGVAYFAGASPGEIAGAALLGSAIGALAAVNPFLALRIAAGLSGTTIAGFVGQAYRQQVVPIAAAKKARGLEYAELAKNAYSDQPRVVGNGWLFQDTLENNLHSGYYGRVFMRGNEIAICYAGTDDIPDIGADIFQGLASGGAEYDLAIEDARAIIDNPVNQGKQIIFVGHSLGGGLATAAAAIFQRPGITFNGAGVHPWTVSEYGGNLDNINQLVDAYRVQGEFLSTLQDSWSVTGLLMPNSQGTAYWLPSNANDNFGVRHKMQAIFDGLNAL